MRHAEHNLRKLFSILRLFISSESWQPHEKTLKGPLQILGQAQELACPILRGSLRHLLKVSRAKSRFRVYKISGGSGFSDLPKQPLLDREDQEFV